MTRSEVLFKCVDVLCDPMQNYKKFKGVTKEKQNVVYDESHPKDCVAEIYYRPELIGENKPKIPVVVNVHGGGFVKGDMHYRRSVCSRFADQGYFVFNINYRLAPKYPFPASMIDCANAMNYLHVLAEKYNINLDKVCVTGDSAGAHFAAQMVCMAYNTDLTEKIGAPAVTVKPALLLAFCGPYDLIRTIQFVKLPWNLVWDIGRCYFHTPEYTLKKDFSNMNDAPGLYETNVLNWVNTNWCPCFLVSSDKDVICKGHAAVLKEKLDEVGIENKMFSSHKFADNHCFHLNFFTKASKECFAEVLPYMAEKLK